MIDQTNDNKQGEEKTDVSGDPIKELNERLEKCLKEKEDYLNGWKRAKADLINYQKDEARRFEEVLKFGNIELIKDFIPVLDSFAALERTLEGEPLASLDARPSRPPPPMDYGGPRSDSRRARREARPRAYARGRQSCPKPE